MNNKTKNNEKFARNTIRARKAIKKHSNEQSTQTKGKRWYSRLLALIGCLLLVSALAVPCFADYDNGSFDPAVSTIPAENLYLNYPDTFFDLSGWYRLEFSDYTIPAEQVTSLGITDGTSLTTVFADDTAYFGFYENNGIIDGWEINQLVLGVNSSGTAYIKGLRPDGITPLSFEGYLWVKDYPLNNVYDSDAARGAWSLFSFETVRYAGGSDGSISGEVTNIWSNIMHWITSALASIQSVFYLNGSLTFLGTLSIIGVSIALGWLIIGIVTRFFQLRG